MSPLREQSANVPLPRCLAFVADEYLKPGDTYVRMAEIASIQEADITGSTRIYTVLVPRRRLTRSLRIRGRMGWIMEVSDGSFNPSDASRAFRIGAPSGERFEPLVIGWTTHNRTVLTPDPRFLSTFGLVPESIHGDDQRTEWHDLDGPTYGVVKVQPVTKHEGPDECATAYVDVLRSYVERYAAERESAIVAVYYEQRSLKRDDELESLLGSEEALFVDMPGRTFEVKRMPLSEYPYFVAIWGTRLVLKPSARSRSDDEPKPALEWPGFSGPMTSRRAWMLSTSDRVYVKDEVLAAYEDRSEFDVDPTDGGIGYEGRWALSFSHAVGRDYFAYELKKIYESCPADVIRHVHSFAVDAEIALQQRRLLGNENIGKRAAKLIAAFFDVVEAVHSVGVAVLRDMEIETLGKPTRERAEYYGWWTLDEFKALGFRAPQSMTKSDFLTRCATVAKLIERLKEAPLRKILLEIGMPKKDVNTRHSLQLLGMLAVLGELAAETGLRLPDDAQTLSTRWNDQRRVDAVKKLFALRDLRDLASHPTGEGAKKRIADDLAVFDVDPASCKTGWGLALDKVYDLTSAALNDIALLLRNSIAEQR